MHFKAIIFDFFGVVGQSTYQLVLNDINITDEQQLQLTDLHKAMDNGFFSDAEFLQVYAQILHMNYDDFVAKYYESERRFQNSKQIIDLIARLRKNYKVGLLSNVGADGYEQFIKPLVDNFDTVVTSFHVQLAKPEMAIFEYTAKQLDVDVSECIMIDDSETNCEGARAAGMEAIKFDTVKQLVTELAKFTHTDIDILRG